MNTMSEQQNDMKRERHLGYTRFLPLSWYLLVDFRDVYLVFVVS